ncbi:tripartite tricarboxylate transporter permease [Pannonibacter phragmitetus]|uniref:tripartite tricarboxylate transporter permease n=1 Tax=Pannonibacter phragmitetus TaxID=121719 RepID=UPI001AD8A185
MAVSILISFTFSWDVLPALSLMIGIFMGGVYGGSRTAILLNIPGAPSAIATALDGYPMAQRGEAGEAIGVTTVMSFFGGLIGILVLALAAPAVSDFAIRFQPRDFMLLAILGLLLVGSLSGESLMKGVFAGSLGLMIGSVGLDPLTMDQRFTFGSPSLMGGISFIAVMIGMFGVSEALMQLHTIKSEAVKQKISRIVPRFSTIRKHLPLSLQTSAIGVVVGALPGTGGDIAALMAYDHAKRVTKDPEVPFGKGAIEGLVAPETANNAAVGGAFIPMMTLGIPGDAVTAIMIGALFIHGLNPGPLLMVQPAHVLVHRQRADDRQLLHAALRPHRHPPLRQGGGTAARAADPADPAAVHRRRLCGQQPAGDVYWMLGFGVLGYFMRLYGYSLGPVILGVILSRLLDDNWRRAIISEQESLPMLFKGILTSPLSATLMAGVVLILLSKTPLWRRIFRKRA